MISRRPSFPAKARAPVVALRAPTTPRWEVRSPMEQRGIPESRAETDPHLLGYFSRPATSLIQMLEAQTTRIRCQ